MRALLLIALAFTTACQQEPNFDERFRAAQGKVGQTAQEIDAQILARQKAQAGAASSAEGAALTSDAVPASDAVPDSDPAPFSDEPPAARQP
ncbi:hypothetical protein RM533_03775 [Croceicoccus sp. F390]|uniref:Lipoprotein n=1 Tax=Croceicoccus esteveae TaxID=3075597 RepID=A0ABU2ZG66_9SPHN|nr:hypothetical protein [Croceicoccus sp. F390]MDT0575299.1 hypothetical protein [Croceicoccus sp. F390]